MIRKIMQDLIKWKNSETDMPLMLAGARQVGKTYILDKFCRENYEDYIYINLEKDEAVQTVFDDTIDPEKIIESIAILKNLKILPDKTIIFFDEIQISERAVTSLKYFNESKSKLKIVCAGSLLGIALNRYKNSYPVGKVMKLTLYPMDFEEFIWALKQEDLTYIIEECFFNNTAMIQSIHDKALEMFKAYLYVGGMPASVLEYIKKDYRLSMYDNIVKSNIIEAYTFDMSKYTTAVENIKISKLYNSIPRQLGRENNKFIYKVIEEKAQKRNYETAIDWLINSNLVLKCIMAEIPEIPLKVYEKESMFKIYLSDTGLLCELAGIGAIDLMGKEISQYMGMLCENYIAQSFVSNKINLHYWKSKNDAEIDFLINIEGSIIPVEVKASINTKSKSLKVYTGKYKPEYAIRISSKNFGFVNNIKSVPHYAAYLIK